MKNRPTRRRRGGEEVTIGQSVKEYLVSHGITQAFVARKCGWTKQKASNIFSGKQRLTFEDGKKVCNVLGLPTDYFFSSVSDQNSA